MRQGLPHEQLAPAWQLMLLGDGSPTRHLRLLTREAIAVDVTDMSPIGEAWDGAPEAIQLLPGPKLRRQVWLRTASGTQLAYAVSWWHTAQADAYLANWSLPVWDNLSRWQAELFRDIRGICYGQASALEAAWREQGPFWGRHYLFWHQGQPLTLIYEVFSPYLRHYLGLPN